MVPPRLFAICLLVAVSAFSPSPVNPDDDPILGFSKAGTVEQLALEATFEEHLTASNLRSWMKTLTARPHHVGSAFTKEKVQFMVDKFTSWGYDVEVEEFTVLFPTPKVRVVELVAPTRYKAKLTFPETGENISRAVKREMLPGFNAFSADGDVTAELVYVNQGIPRDYEDLKQRGIDVAGKIVIARYGGAFRGVKPKLAAQHGAIGCILYSDPRDDGYGRGEVYPEGPFKPEHGVQRGSVIDMPLYPGDPLTPGVGAKPDTDRLALSEAPTLMKIPVLPISHKDAQPLLEALGGPVAPARWRGGLPITYHIGPGPAKVHLKLAFDWKLETAYNVVARMEGSEYPDEWIMRGNHHDAWVFGAADPMSGMVSMMEEARAIGELAKTGWRPRRTIVYAGWDAEEPGIIGSTEWVEHHAETLRDNLVVYINTDANGRGFWGVGGSHTLERFINEVGRAVKDPQTGVSVAERARALRDVRGDAEATSRKDLRIAPLGSGSDFTPFIQHLGVAALNLSFGGENPSGAYHTAFDTFEHYTRFGDPGFSYGVTLANVSGRTVLRLANADVLPYRFAGYVDNVKKYATEVMQLADDMRAHTMKENARIARNAYALTTDPTKSYVTPVAQDDVPYFNFAPLQNALTALDQAAKTYDAAMQSNGNAMPAEKQEALNKLMMGVERLMTREEGLPRRPWFKHQIYAPGFYTGYGVKTLPGIREALEQRNWEEAAEHIEIVARVLNRVTETLHEATTMLE